jgi:hypothetical protein
MFENIVLYRNLFVTKYRYVGSFKVNVAILSFVTDRNILVIIQLFIQKENVVWHKCYSHLCFRYLSGKLPDFVILQQ